MYVSNGHVPGSVYINVKWVVSIHKINDGFNFDATDQYKTCYTNDQSNISMVLGGYRYLDEIILFVHPRLII